MEKLMTDINAVSVLFCPGPLSRQGTPSLDGIGAVETAAEASPAISALSTGARR